jgi:IS5 family transposase
MQRQRSFAEAEYAGKKKQTRRDKFLAEMEQAVPWSRLVARLAPLYPKGERGRPPIGLERMLRVYFVQQWYGLADEAVEDALYDSQALRGFAGIALNRDPVPDATTVLHFRHWLERHDLAKGLFDEVGAMLEERGLLMRQGTIVDATIIAAPSSTKNKQQSRDPEMHQTKKGNQWYFGMKAHIGVDVASGLVHTVVGTAANEADITQTAALLATPGRTSGLNLRNAMYHGTSRSSAASSKRSRKPCGSWRSRSSARSRRCAPWSSIPSTSSRTAFAIRSCAIAACIRTPHSSTRCSPWPIW